jgi:diguanylate cyclase (GGDEF)-like protein/PAS domain S-box-containing protein
MSDRYKPREQLLAELEEMRRRVLALQLAEARAAWARAESTLFGEAPAAPAVHEIAASPDPEIAASPESDAPEPAEIAKSPDREIATSPDSLFRIAPIGLARIDSRGRIVEANPTLADLSGYAATDLAGRRFTDFIPREEAVALLTAFRSLVEGRARRSRTENRWRRKDGRLVWVDVAVALVGAEAGRPPHFVAAVQPSPPRRQTETALRQENRRLAGAVLELEQRTREISVLSEAGDLLQACRTTEEAYGVIGRMAAQLFPNDSGSVSLSGASPNMVEAVATWGTVVGDRLFGLDECWALRRGRVHVSGGVEAGPVCRHLRSAGPAVHVCVPMMAHGEAVGLLSLVTEAAGPLEDAKQRLATTVAEHIALALANLKLRETLRRQSIRDPLTTLFNRRYMEESLAREMRRASRGRHPVGIIMLDLDHFKAFNDAFGHEVGDRLLREVGAVLQRSIRGEDIACRYGGEEFILILPEASLIDAAQRAEQLRESIRTINVLDRRQAPSAVTVSCGVAIYPDHGPTAEAVVRAADAALYHAKAHGRDRVAVNPGGAGPVDSLVELPRG